MNLVLLTRFLPMVKSPKKFSGSMSYLPDATRRHRMRIGEREAIYVMLFFEYFAPEYTTFLRFIEHSRRVHVRVVSVLAQYVSNRGRTWFDDLVRNFGFITPFIEFLRDSVRVGHSVGDVINDSFTWAHTPEGQEYWEDLNSKLGAFISRFNFAGRDFTSLNPTSIRREFCRLCRAQSSFRAVGNSRLNSDIERSLQEEARAAEEFQRAMASMQSSIQAATTTDANSITINDYTWNIQTNVTSASPIGDTYASVRATAAEEEAQLTPESSTRRRARRQEAQSGGTPIRVTLNGGMMSFVGNGSNTVDLDLNDTLPQ